MTNKLDEIVGKKSLTEMLAEPDTKETGTEEKTVEKRIKVLTISATEYRICTIYEEKWGGYSVELYDYDMVGVVNVNNNNNFYNGFLPIGNNWEKCPEGTEAVVAIKGFDSDYLYGTAMIRKKSKLMV